MNDQTPGTGQAAQPLVISHENSLGKLRALGWEPRTIYDIGAFQGVWSDRVRRIFPDSEIIQFEANAENAPALAHRGFRHFLTALAAEDNDTRIFFAAKNAVATGNSLYRENTAFYAGENLILRQVVTRRLDSLVAEHKLNPAQLIKIDVQGAELEVIAGAAAAMASCEALIVEASLLAYNEGAPLFGDVVSVLTQLGFKCVDLSEIAMQAGMILQLDLLFVREPLYQKLHAAAGLT